jgi:hypothetical protein
VNKKRFITFLSVVSCIILIPILILIFKQPKSETSTPTATSQSDVYQFYYRCVPGLKMAQDAELVRDVNKRLDWPGKDASVYIDSIWYNNKSVYLFYHVVGLPSNAYLGGELFLPANEPVKKRSFHGSASIGRASEKGILYNESYYSCLRLLPILDQNNQPLSQIDTIYFTPFINIPSPKGLDIIESTQLKSFEIPLNFNEEEEPVDKTIIDYRLDLEGQILYFYQVNISPSSLKVYFQFLNSGRDQVYRVKGSYATDKGENYSFDIYPRLITEYPYHYIMELAPLHMMPETIKLNLETIYCIGGDEVNFTIDTSDYTAKSRSYKTEIGEDKVKNTSISISNITLKQHSAEVLISYASDTENHRGINLTPLNPYWLRENEVTINSANQILIQDGDYNQYNLNVYNHGAETLPGEGIRLKLDRAFWDATDKIYIKIKNLSYELRITKEVDLRITSENPTEE